MLDLTRAVAGPFCSMMLADLGARVIKIEDARSGDETRGWGPPFLDGVSTYFLSMNRNKESVAADLKSERGRRLVTAIARRADVALENFRPGVADRLGIGAASLRARNPRLIYASISGFGQTGPHRLKPGYDLILQAVSGSMHLSAAPHQDAVKVAFPVADILAGLFTAQAIVAALYRREKTGHGARLEVSLLEGMLCAMSNFAAGVLNTGEEPPRVSVAQPNIVPYQLFHCQDGPIVAGAPNQRLWERFARALEREEWLADPRFATNALRTRHREVLVDLIERTLITRPAAAWLERLELFEVPCGAVLSLGQALAQPQVAARGAIVESAGCTPVPDSEPRPAGSGCDSFPTDPKIRFVGNPMRFDDFVPPCRAPAALGAHTSAVEREFLGEENEKVKNG